MGEIDLTDLAWENFVDNNYKDIDIEKKQIDTKNQIIPKPTEIYISTKTKISYLNTEINLKKIFWKIPIIDYQTFKQGVIKKQIKINCDNTKEVEELENKLSKEKMLTVDIISQINNPNARKTKFKDVRKINIGLCKKDLITLRSKKKGAFYNCFVLIQRLQWKGQFKEVHIKVFNTGKLEIPGIQEDDFLYLALDRLVQILQPYIEKKLDYYKNKIDTVLINSNFSSRFFINRNKFYNILKYKYNFHVMFDPCSYPGIRCKYYYNKNNDGICMCEKMTKKKSKHKNRDHCKEVSFMIFRTGSILIVGNCTEYIINIIYKCLIKILKDEYNEIVLPGVVKNKIKKLKKCRKKFILVSQEPVGQFD